MLRCTALLILVVLACGWDLVYQRIPNVLTLGAGGCALALAAGTGDPRALGTAMCGAAVGGLAFLPLYSLGAMGAGDVKLMAASGAFLGPWGALLASVLALVAGAFMATLVVVLRVLEPEFPADIAKRSASDSGLSALWRGAAAVSIARKERFPYAAAIAAGVLAALWIDGSFGVFMSALDA